MGLSIRYYEVMLDSTLVIASYKYGHLAAGAIESALEQTLPFSRILFVDDGVGDCAHLPSIYPEVEYVFRNENMGTVRNFQDMLERVNTGYCMFLGADNWLRPDTLEKLSVSHADIVTYDIVVVGELKREITSRHPQEVVQYMGGYYWDRSAGHHGSMLYKTAKAKEVGYWSAGGRTLEDMNLYNGMIARGATREHIKEGLLYYRRHRENFNPCK